MIRQTDYTYDVSDPSVNSNGGVYGNLAKEVVSGAGIVARITMHFYAIRDDATPPASGSPYIVDRPWAEYTWDGSWQSQAYTAYFYDGQGAQGGATQKAFHLISP